MAQAMRCGWRRERQPEDLACARTGEDRWAHESAPQPLLRRSDIDPFGHASWLPTMVMGTTGTPASNARWKGPFLNGSSFPSGERVPSGNTSIGSPDCSTRTASLHTLERGPAVGAIDGNKAGSAHGSAKKRNLKEFLLGDDGNAPAEQQGNDRRVQVRGMIGHEEIGAPGLQLLTANGTHADSGDDGIPSGRPIAKVSTADRRAR